MPRSRTFLSGLLVAILAGGAVGIGLAALATGAQGGWLPGQGAAIGASVAAGVGYLVAWLILGRTRRAPAPRREYDVAPPLAEVATEIPDPEPAAVAAAFSPAPDPAPATTDDLLVPGAVRLLGEATSRAEAIEEAGALLVETGAVQPDYVAAMHARERGTSTHMGNALAVPHGNHAASALVHRSALALVRYREPLDWRGNRVRFVVAIAAVDDPDQVRLVSRVAEVFLQDATVARLEVTEDPAEVVAAFARAGR